MQSSPLLRPRSASFGKYLIVVTCNYGDCTWHGVSRCILAGESIDRKNPFLACNCRYWIPCGDALEIQMKVSEMK